LAFDQKFRDAIAVRDGGARLASVPATTATPIEIPRYAPYREAIRARTAEISRAGVTILTGSAHGSGFFVSDDGLILTNQHVVGHAEQVNVRLAAGVEVVGRVLRRDAVRDVALVKVDIARTRPLPIGMEVPAVGSDVYTLGTPSDPGLAGTLTRGIVSAFRTFDRGGVELPMIQSDAAIHGGNSGGPLMDASGNVVGIAVAGAARDGQTRAGLNFFIPIEDALRYLNIRLGQPRELRF
jgi:S1-C subfamily serine protease